jgi:hypothetical protein
MGKYNQARRERILSSYDLEGLELALADARSAVKEFRGVNPAAVAWYEQEVSTIAKVTRAKRIKMRSPVRV